MMPILAIAAAVVAVAEAHAGLSQPDERPNFLVITSEDMSPNLGCYGDPNAITPNLDELARRGNAYKSAYATGPICSPARTALLFGQYQTSLGAGNHRSRAETPQNLLGFASHLREAGYFCTNAPKVDYNSSRIWEIERATYDRGADWRHPERAGRPFLSIINIAVSHQSYTSVLPFEQYRTQVRNKLPPEWVRDPAEVHVPPYFPDTPAVRKELARYADCVSLMDIQAGEILSRLDEDGLAEDTIVIYFSDHGAGHPRHKSTPFATGLQVPFIVYCPPKYAHLLRAPAGSMCEDIVSFVDIGPTLLHLAGVEVPEPMHGVPFLGENAEPRSLAFGALDRRAESFHLARTVTDGRHVYIRSYMPHIPFGQPKGYGFPSAIYQELARLDRTGDLEGASADYMQPHQPELLFDLLEDPFEIRDVSDDASYGDVLDRMRRANERHVGSIADINFIPEEELARRSTATAWADAVPAETRAAVHAAASLVGRGSEVIPDQLAYATHSDAAVRWWGIIGLRNQIGPNIDDALVAAMADESAVVAIEAASAAASRDLQPSRARTLLLTHVGGSDPRVAHRAARALQLLRAHDEETVAAMAAAAARHPGELLNEVYWAILRQSEGSE
ncbi:MAG: sulfatase [Planctomycetota bacterium]